MVKLILLKNKGVKALNVIQMTTEDRLNETKKLFEQVKPLLEKGFSYIDDRSLKFNGNFDETLTELKNFKAHWEE